MAERLLGASLRFSRSCYRILFETIGGPWPSRGRHEHIRWPRGKPWPSYTLKLYFFINSRAATVMAFTPGRIVGSGTCQKRLECREGTGTPVFWLLVMRPGPIAATMTMKVGQLCTSTPNSP